MHVRFVLLSRYFKFRGPTKLTYSLRYSQFLFLFQIPCPGNELELDSNETEACRFLGLSDGTVINQSPVSKFLCSAEALNAIQLKMAIDYHDGVGKGSAAWHTVLKRTHNTLNNSLSLLDN